MRRQEEGGRTLPNDYVGWNGEVPVWAETIKTFLPILPSYHAMTFLPFSIISSKVEINPLIHLVIGYITLCSQIFTPPVAQIFSASNHHVRVHLVTENNIRDSDTICTSKAGDGHRRYKLEKFLDRNYFLLFDIPFTLDQQ